MKQSLSIIVLGTLLAGLMASCDQLISAAGGIKPVAVTSVMLSETGVAVPIGGTHQLAVRFAPAAATDSTGTWESSNASVATVSANGLVSGVGVGTANINFTSSSGKKTATCAVACAFNISSFAGYVLVVDQAKHFTSKTEYYNGNYHGVFNADGSFQEEWYSDYSTTQQATQSSGYKGTYTWDPVTFILTRNIRSTWNAAAMAWNDPYIGSISHIATSRKVFTDHQMLSVYLPDIAANPTSWEITYTYSFTDQANSARDYRNSYKYSYSISAGQFTFNEIDTVTTQAYPLGYTTYLELEQGPCASLPAGTSLTPGKTVTYRVLPSLYQHQTANYSTNPPSLNPAVSEDLAYDSYTFMNTGLYIVTPAVIQSKSIGR